jgi:hypothetical protein
MVLTYSEYDDVGKTGQRQLVAVVGPPDRVRTSVTASGGGFGVADPVPRREVYAEGTTLYRRFPRYNGTLYRRDTGAIAPADVVVFGRAYLSEALRVDSSRLVRTTASDGDRLFRIAFAGDDDPRTVDARGLLVVDHRGVVRSLQRRYAANASVELSATVSLRYEFGNVDVERPPWLPRAEAALGENTSAFVPTSRPPDRTAGANATDANATAA